MDPRISLASYARRVTDPLDNGPFLSGTVAVIPRPVALVVACVGLAVMVAASVYAPAQPELLQDGAACEIAPCGTLEDPERWRTAWWLWSAGLVALLAAVPLIAPRSRVRASWLAIGLLAAPLWLVGLLVVA